MHVFKKLRVRQKADNPANCRYLKEIEKYKERLQLIAPPNLNFPENRPVHLSTVATAAYHIFGRQSAKALVVAMANIQRGEAAGQRILQVLDTKIEVADHPNSISIDSFEHSVEFRDVCFTGV